MCVLSPGLFWGGEVNNVLLSVSMKYCASCLLWSGGWGEGGNNVLLSVSTKYSVLVVSCGVGVGNNILLSPARWHMLRHTISPLV